MIDHLLVLGLNRDVFPRSVREDPLLPDAIAPGDERRQLLEAMVRYDRLGRAAWAGLLAMAKSAASTKTTMFRWNTRSISHYPT